MKICFLADATSPHTIRWAKYFIKNTNDVSIITLTPPSTPVEGIKIYQLKKGRKLKFLTFNRRINELKQLLNEIKPDIVHAHYITTYGLMASLTNFHPLILSAWGSDILIEAKKSFFMKVRTKRALRGADLFHVDGIKPRKALEGFDVPSDLIKTICFGIDAERASPKAKTEKIKEKYGCQGHPVIISLRSLNPIYDVGSLIQAIPIVLKEVPGARFMIVGSGSQEQMLKDMTESLKVSKEVIFTGRIPFQEIPSYLASADIYDSTSLSDAGLAASTGEAMACELPVVITDDPDNRDWVTDGENGFIVPIKSPEKIAEKIIILLKNPDLCKKFGKLSRENIIKRNDYNTEMSKIEKIYADLIQKHKK